jgi:hypothetical protein
MTASTEQPNGLVLHGLDGSNPLAFLAALGTLRTLSLAWRNRKVKMVWIMHAGAWRPAINAGRELHEQDVIDALLSYNESLKSATDDENADRFDFTSLGDIIGVAPDLFADFTCKAFDYATNPKSGLPRREPLDFVAAYGNPCCLSDKGTVEPTQLSFANGQSGQKLLRAFRELREALTEDILNRSMFSLWAYTDPRPTFRWDPADCRPYAHLGSDPGNSATTPIRTMQGANYLAFLGLPLLPSFPVQSRIRTTGFRQFARKWTWTWPIWSVPLEVDCVRSLLTLPDLLDTPVDRAKLSSYGVDEVFRSRRFNYQKGVYFSPSAPA